MNEYKSPFVKALAERWVKWKPLIDVAIEKMPLPIRIPVHSLLDSVNVINKMPEILKGLDNDPEKRIMIEGEIKALALEIDKEPPLILEIDKEPPLIDISAKEPDDNIHIAEVEPINEIEPEPEIDEPLSEEEEITPPNLSDVVDSASEAFEVPEEGVHKAVIAPLPAIHSVKFKKKRKKREKKAE